MNFGVYCSAAYFAPYMLNDLKFSYIQFVLVDVIQLVVKYLVFPVWGKLNDKHKSSTILGIAGFSMPLVPILWAFSRNFYELVLIQIYAGVTWAAFDLSSFNILLDTTDKSKREKYIAYYNVLNGFAILFGSLFGTLVVKNSFFWSNYIFVFMVSGLLRYSASIFFLGKLKALKTIQKLKFDELFKEAISITNQEFNRIFVKTKGL
jgi:MFS family permease